MFVPEYLNYPFFSMKLEDVKSTLYKLFNEVFKFCLTIACSHVSS